MSNDFKARFFLQIGIVFGIMVVVAAAMFFLSLDIKATTEKFLETQADANARSEQLNDLVRLREEAKLAEPKLEILQATLSDKDGLFIFPDQVIALGADHNVSVRFVYGEEQPDNIGFNISAMGIYRDIVSFIGALEDEYFFKILSSFDIIKIEDGQYQGDISGIIYFDAKE